MAKANKAAWKLCRLGDLDLARCQPRRSGSADPAKITLELLSLADIAPPPI